MTGSTKTVILDLNSFFSEMVSEAMNRRKLTTLPLVSKYLVDLLQSYIYSKNLEIENTLAEMYLKAMQEESQKIKFEKLKKLGDLSLYISGFFGDSLKRKVVDIDYYAEIGGRAYDCLATESHENLYSRVYEEISVKFLDFVDVLTLISQKSLVQSNEDLLRLYDRYITTGSELAKEQLLEKGLIPTETKKTEQ
ncbi:MAG: hypothetical protein KDD58_00400 [Bdellovibrionales bacterium]|nr:hypothetical protein [Bdellovibrionales bacterium]